MAPDPRAGLRRRPQFSELEAKARKGNPKLVGLSYDPIRVLFDPLHVKMAQELGEQARAQTQNLIDVKSRQDDERLFTSRTGLDPASAAVIREAAEPEAEQNGSDPPPPPEPKSKRKKDDDAEMEPVVVEDDDKPDDKGGGGSRIGRGLTGFAGQMLLNPTQPQPEGEPSLDTGTMMDYQKRGPPPPPPPSAGMAFREAVEVQAELHAL